jgi:predicted phage terminase large subunit-like protein
LRPNNTIHSLAAQFLKQTILSNPYVAMMPTSKQAVFLTLPVEEALYGGSAGGGKSVALLAAALQFVLVPGYRALLLRRSYTDLNLPGALIPMSHAWLAGTDAKWNGRLNEWTFPSGASLTFGYLDSDADKYRYQGAAFQFIGFDELTQFKQTQYEYLFSRLRRATDNIAPLRVRSATNPGGVGHDWVRKRFITSKPTSRIFIPAKLEDNPHLDQHAYDQALRKLDPVTRQQLRYGDWLAHSEGLFARSWFRYYRKRRDGYDLGNRTVESNACARFGTVDVAGTEQRSGSHDPDWTVIQVWDLASTGELILVDQWRSRVSTPEVESAVLRMVKQYEIPWIGIEAAGIGLAVVQSLRRRGLAVRALKASGNKIVRSQAAQIRMEAGTVFFPAESNWLAELETELSLFPSAPHDDQVDALSYAALWAQRSAGPVPISAAP